MKAWELLSTPGAWTQGAMARIGNGSEVHSKDDRAICYSMDGAIKKCYGFNQSIEMITTLYWYIWKTNNGKSHFRWEDEHERTQEEVIKVLKELDI